MFLNRHIVQLNSWYFLSQFYLELTWLSVRLLPVSSTVNIDYIASPPNVTLLAVELKKLRIKHKLLCAKM